MKLSKFLTLVSALIFILLLAGSARANASLTLFTPPINTSNLNMALQFTSHGHVLAFRPDEFYVSNGRYVLHVEFVDANPVKPTSDTPTALNDFTVPPLSNVSYANLWQGITLSYDSTHDGVFTSSYRLEPHADPRAIHLLYNAPITIDPNGTLTIEYATGEITESTPVAWQVRSNVLEKVSVAFILRGNREIGIAVGDYDASAPLFIDPTLTWNTFLGGTGTDFGYAVTADGKGNSYIAGFSATTWGSPVHAFTGSSNAFIAKLDSNGNLIWNTFLGVGGDTGNGIAVDGNGNVYVAGASFATWGSPVRAYGSGMDAYAAKLDSSGNLIWNAFLGGSGSDYGAAIVIDGNGNLYMSGVSDATWGSPVRAYVSGQDAFAAKLDSSGNLIWNTFLGGSGTDEQALGVAVDGSGNAYVAGYGNATWGSPVRSFTASVYGDNCFAAKLDSSGNLSWNTFLSGTGGGDCYAIAVDRNGNAYVAGDSGSTWGSPVRAYVSGSDAFAAKLSSSGNLIWNTFLGGSGNDYGLGIAIDGIGDVYIGGYGNATWGNPFRAYVSGNDAFVARLNASGNLSWNTFLGGSGSDVGVTIAADGNGNVYLAGSSNATWGSPILAITSGEHAFVAKIRDLFFIRLPLIVR